MSTILLIVHLIAVVALIGVVLLQRSEGGALGMGGGGAGGGFGGILSGRGAGSVLTRTTAILAAVFFVTSITMAILASRGRPTGSFIDQAPQTETPSAPLTEGPSAPPSSANPLSPATPAPSPAPAPAPTNESPAQPQGQQQPKPAKPTNP